MTRSCVTTPLGHTLAESTTLVMLDMKMQSSARGSSSDTPLLHDQRTETVSVGGRPLLSEEASTKARCSQEANIFQFLKA